MLVILSSTGGMKHDPWEWSNLNLTRCLINLFEKTQIQVLKVIMSSNVHPFMWVFWTVMSFMLLKHFFGHEKPVLPFKTLPWVDKITNLASYPVIVCKLVCGAEKEPCSLMQAFGYSHSAPMGWRVFQNIIGLYKIWKVRGLRCFQPNTEH